jgi:hypothetical protein
MNSLSNYACKQKEFEKNKFSLKCTRFLKDYFYFIEYDYGVLDHSLWLNGQSINILMP